MHVCCCHLPRWDRSIQVSFSAVYCLDQTLDLIRLHIVGTQNSEKTTVYFGLYTCLCLCGMVNRFLDSLGFLLKMDSWHRGNGTIACLLLPSSSLG